MDAAAQGWAADHRIVRKLRAGHADIPKHAFQCIGTPGLDGDQRDVGGCRVRRGHVQLQAGKRAGKRARARLGKFVEPLAGLNYQRVGVALGHAAQRKGAIHGRGCIGVDACAGSDYRRRDGCLRDATFRGCYRRRGAVSSRGRQRHRTIGHVDQHVGQRHRPVRHVYRAAYRRWALGQPKARRRSEKQLRGLSCGGAEKCACRAAGCLHLAGCPPCAGLSFCLRRRPTSGVQEGRDRHVNRFNIGRNGGGDLLFWAQECLKRARAVSKWEDRGIGNVAHSSLRLALPSAARIWRSWRSGL